MGTWRPRADASRGDRIAETAERTSVFQAFTRQEGQLSEGGNWAQGGQPRLLALRNIKGEWAKHQLQRGLPKKQGPRGR